MHIHGFIDFGSFGCATTHDRDALDCDRDNGMDEIACAMCSENIDILFNYQIDGHIDPDEARSAEESSEQAMPSWRGRPSRAKTLTTDRRFCEKIIANKGNASVR